MDDGYGVMWLVTRLTWAWVLAFWVIGTIAVTALARDRGQSGFAFFLFSLMFSPILGALFLAAAGTYPDQMELRGLASGRLKRCPECAEAVLSQALRCKHCGNRFAHAEAQSAIKP